MTKKIFTPNDLYKSFPLGNAEKTFIEKSRDTAKAILHFKQKRKVIVVGPCSIHSYGAALKYAHRLRLLQKKVSSQLFLVMRCFIEKPRTKVDWKGFLHDPFLDNSAQIEVGISLSRKLFIEITSLEVPIAMEFLDPLTSIYFHDLVTWGFIGARTTTSQPHRQLASYLKMPIGFKNPLDGNLEQAVNAISVSQTPQRFLYLDEEARLAPVESSGNFHSHLVLRGGRNAPNYSIDAIGKAKQELKNTSVEAKIMIDCAHDNSGKSLEKQKEVFREASISMAKDADIIGLMLESNLLRGSQRISPSYVGGFNDNISLTDPCLSWDETEALILETYQLMSKSSSEYVEGSTITSSFVNIGSS